MQNLNKDNLHIKVENQVVFSYNSLAALIQQHGLSISKYSPLYMLTKEHIEGNNMKEKDIKFNDPDWKNILIALCNPIFKQTSFTIYPGSIMGISYCINQKYSETIVACQILENKQIKVSFPYKPSDILTDLFNSIQVNSAVYSGREKLEVSKQGLLALFAAIDTIKEVLLISLLSHQYITDFKLPNNQLDITLKASLKDKHNDNRWLVTLLRLFDVGLYPEEALIITQNSFDELVSLGLIINKDDEYWIPSSELMDIASSFLTPLPAFYQEAVVISPENITVESNSLTIRSVNSLCLIDFEIKTKTKKNISLKWLNKDEYWLEMMGRVTPPKVELKPIEELKEESIYKCPSCGAIVDKDQKFCTSCGHKLPEDLEPVAEESPEIKICPKCGAELKPGTKFCTECGAKV